MPATAGRVRMPANNRVHSSAALQTHGIWQSAIGYDPYAPNKDEKKDKSTQKSSVTEPEPENAYASFQGLLALARITSSSADEARGSCKKCGRVGHLTFQCRNFLSVKEDVEGKDPDAIHAAVLSGLEKLKGDRVKRKRAVESEDSSEEEESESSDSDYDSEIERAIAEKYGKRLTGCNSRSKNRRRDASDISEDDETRSRNHRGKSKKRSSKKVYSDSENDGERTKRREKKRRKDYDSYDDQKDRKRKEMRGRKEKSRRSHHHSEDNSSDTSIKHRHKRRNRKGHSASDSDRDDYSRVGRDKNRSQKSRKHRHEED